MKMMRIAAAICLVIAWLPVQAETPEEKGLKIATESKARDKGWGDSAAEMTMILRNKNGNESVRKVRSRSLEVEGDGDKGLTIFDEPFDVKGTAFLSFTHPLKDDEQWMYLPALKRVKRISSSNKSGPFMGSEFAFEDLTSFEIPKYKYKYLGDTSLDGDDAFKVEMFPQYRRSGYTRLVAWIDKSEYRIRKVDYFDRKNDPLKTLTYADYKLYKDKHWRAHTMTMVNHQTGKETVLSYSNYQFDNGFTDADFNRNTLKRAR
tara:strand:- start:1295 stop:2080 length:786 start_codon:yes stop_codon:yes gene_type:complete